MRGFSFALGSSATPLTPNDGFVTGRSHTAARNTREGKGPWRSREHFGAGRTHGGCPEHDKGRCCATFSEHEGGGQTGAAPAEGGSAGGRCTSRRAGASLEAPKHKEKTKNQHRNPNVPSCICRLIQTKRFAFSGHCYAEWITLSHIRRSLGRSLIHSITATGIHRWIYLQTMGGGDKFV